jgi:hypothetical protein
MAGPSRNEGKKRSVRTPLVEVKERFGSKEGLIKEIEKLSGKKDLLAERLGDKGIEHVSNSKLLRLHRLLTEVTNQFQGRAALVDAYLELKHRKKDGPYRDKLMTYTLGRLYDMYQVAQRKASSRA